MAILQELPRVERFIRRCVDSGIAPGAVVAWQLGAGHIRYQCAGLQESHGTRPMAADSLFRLRSQNEPITGIAIMMLLEEGRLELDQPLHDIFPAFAQTSVLVDGDTGRARPAARPITMRHLLTHTAGLRRPDERGQPTSREEFCERVAALPLVFDPGARFEYSIAADVLGAVAQVVSGVPFEDFLRQRLFDPLGMHDTAFAVPREQLGRLTAPEPAPGSGALVSTARDYARFASMLVHEGSFEGRQLMRPDTVQLAMSNLLPEGVEHVELPRGVRWPDTGFGAALSVRTGPGDVPTGVCSGYGPSGTGVWLDRQRRFLFLFLMPQSPSAENLHLRAGIIEAAYADLLDLAPWLFDRT